MKTGILSKLNVTHKSQIFLFIFQQNENPWNLNPAISQTQ